jgi:hypothetical protein
LIASDDPRKLSSLLSLAQLTDVFHTNLLAADEQQHCHTAARLGYAPEMTEGDLILLFSRRRPSITGINASSRKEEKGKKTDAKDTCMFAS